MPERAGRVVARHGLDRDAVGARLDRDADGLPPVPSSSATPTSRSAPGASGTKASAPLTRRLPVRRRRPSARRAAAARGRVDRPAARSRSPGGLHGQVRGAPLARRQLVQHRRGVALGASSRIAVAGRCPSSGTPASTRPHSPSTSIASKASSPAPPCCLVDQQAGPAGLAGRRPQVGQRALVAVERLARGLERLEARQRAAGGLAQEHLLVGQGQVHAAAPSLERSSENGMPLSRRGSGGRPSTRSPIVLRRISSVPPADFRPGRNEIM